jgi:hypothetical protein
MVEEVLFENGAIKITPARVVNGGATYAVANITSVKAQKDNDGRIYGVVAAIFGLVLALTGTTLGIALGAVMLLGGVLLAIFGTYTEVVITTGAAEQKAFRSRDEKTALEVASAINLAIMKRSVALGR